VGLFRYATVREECSCAAPVSSRTSGLVRLRRIVTDILLGLSAVAGALWTYHDLRHPQDSLSFATPLLGISLLLIAGRVRRSGVGARDQKPGVRGQGSGNRDQG
jgi:hypothetical protein